MKNEEILRSASKRNGVLGSPKTATMAAFTYAVLFIALMLLMGGKITINALGLPAIALFLITTFTEYILKTDQTPRWLVIGSFTIAAVLAVLMTVVSV